MLGPLILLDADGGRLPQPSAAKERAILALLALRASQTVRVPELIHSVWGDDPPRTAVKAAQTYVSALRRILPAGIVKTVGDGYLLDIAPDRVDAHNFEVLASRGRERLAAGDPFSAVASFREALELFRGDPLPDLSAQPVGAAEATRLLELRRDVEECLVEGRLELGEHFELVGDLEAAVALEPLRERRWEHLMLALYRSGRQADALRAYQRLRETLAEQLGIEPSTTLQGLERAMLLQNPGLGTPPSALETKTFADPASPRNGSQPVPTDQFPQSMAVSAAVALPRPRSSFIGREGLLTDLLDVIRTQRLVTLTGVGGAGKTRLAIEAALRESWRRGDGVFFVDLATIADPDLLAATIAAAVRLQGEPTDLEVMLINYLAVRQCLVILDNCEHLIEACAELTDRLLTSCPSLTVLATSREPLRIDGEHTIAVPPLSTDGLASEAVALFLARARAVRSNFNVDTIGLECIAGICQRLDGIPLAIELAASRIGHMTIDDIAARLDDRFQLLAGLGQHRPARQATLEAAIGWSWELLSDQERALLRALAVFVGTFDLSSVEAVCGIRPVIDPIGSLVGKSLVVLADDIGHSRYRLMETVRLYALRQLVASGEESSCRDAHRDWYLTQLESHSLDTLNDYEVTGAGIREFPNYRAALDWSVHRGRKDLFARMVIAGALMWEMSPSLIDETARLLHAVIDDPDQPAAYRANATALMADLSMVRMDVAAMNQYAETAVDSAAPPFRALALVALLRTEEAAEVAEAAGLPIYARTCRSWTAATLIAFDPAAALRAFDAIRELDDPAPRSWNRLWYLIGSVLTRLALDDAEGALADARSLEQVESGNEVWGGSFWRYGSILRCMALAHLGRSDEARTVLAKVAAAVVRDHFPAVAHDCLTALAYITSCEGNRGEAARLLQPVALDGQLRMFPMYFFVARFISTLTVQPDGQGPALPTVQAFFEHATAGTTGDPGAAARIDQELSNFIIATTDNGRTDPT